MALYSVSLMQRHTYRHEDGIRVSPHYYNTEDELEQFLDILP